MDLPVWQALYEELSHTNFLPITVALESRGAEGARQWIEAANPSHPSLIDQGHLVADLYGFVNVPMATWIDEEGTIVRPPETAGSTDSFRSMDRASRTMPEEQRALQRKIRAAYLDALRDWAANGERSRFVLAGDEVRSRLQPRDGGRARAAVLARLAEHAWRSGHEADARTLLTEAEGLWPESWAIKRQAWNLEDPLKSFGDEFWAAVTALGEQPYYQPLKDIG